MTPLGRVDIVISAARPISDMTRRVRLEQIGAKPVFSGYRGQYHTARGIQISVAKTMDSTFADRLTTIPMAEFALKWRFTDPKFHVLPPIHLEQIQPLDAPSAGLIWKFILDSKVHAVDPFKPGFFRHHETTAIGDSHENPDEDSRIRKWLYRCAIPFDNQIFLSWQPTWAVKTTWKMLVKYWTSFYDPISDDLTVIDQSLEWCVLFHHEHELHFGTSRPRVATAQSGEPEPPMTRNSKS